MGENRFPNASAVFKSHHTMNDKIPSGWKHVLQLGVRKYLAAARIRHVRSTYTVGRTAHKTHVQKLMCIDALTGM